MTVKKRSTLFSGFVVRTDVPYNMPVVPVLVGSKIFDHFIRLAVKVDELSLMPNDGVIEYWFDGVFERVDDVSTGFIHTPRLE